MLLVVVLSVLRPPEVEAIMMTKTGVRTGGTGERNTGRNILHLSAIVLHGRHDGTVALGTGGNQPRQLGTASNSFVRLTHARVALDRTGVGAGVAVRRICIFICEVSTEEHG